MSNTTMRRIARAARVAVLAWSAGAIGAMAQMAPAAGTAAPAPAAQKVAAVSTSTADHTKFKELQRDFKSGPEVTKACLACHTEAAKQVHKTKHWTWDFLNPDNGQRLGKKNVINNFCTAVPSNYTFCTACHIGYDWKDANYDFTAEEKVDCLVCHDRTGTYKKLPGLAGHPAYQEMEFPPKSGRKVKPADLSKIAQNIGRTSRATCGACHFFGGGGDGVKHGDLDSSMTNPPRYLDVHMDAKGLNFSCGTCHQTSGHEIPGSRYTPTAFDTKGAQLRGKVEPRNAATCQSCHGQTPHTSEPKLNSHTDKVACQTCHIPQYARGGVSTKMSWDWSTAGRIVDGKPVVLKDSAGRDSYDSKKGDFTYDSHVVPEYLWFNGKVTYTLLGDKIDPAGVTRINRFDGSAADPNSRIWPVKVFRGKQPFDLESKSLLVPHTATGYGEKDDTAFWQNYRWEEALEAGAKASGQPFGGKFGFVKTEMSWPITHMVAPKADALTCTQCHSRSGRLQAVDGVYLPGRDANGWLDRLGWLAAALALVGVVAHGGIRIVRSRG
ncbi:MAG: tetrathionate reductase family octaheme c-type cytochrome [Burkholderiales bacterium]